MNVNSCNPTKWLNVLNSYRKDDALCVKQELQSTNEHKNFGYICVNTVTQECRFGPIVYSEQNWRKLSLFEIIKISEISFKSYSKVEDFKLLGKCLKTLKNNFYFPFLKWAEPQLYLSELMEKIKISKKATASINSKNVQIVKKNSTFRKAALAFLNALKNYNKSDFKNQVFAQHSYQGFYRLEKIDKSHQIGMIMLTDHLAGQKHWKKMSIEDICKVVDMNFFSYKKSEDLNEIMLFLSGLPKDELNESSIPCIEHLKNKVNCFHYIRLRKEAGENLTKFIKLVNGLARDSFAYCWMRKFHDKFGADAYASDKNKIMHLNLELKNLLKSEPWDILRAQEKFDQITKMKFANEILILKQMFLDMQNNPNTLADAFNIEEQYIKLMLDNIECNLNIFEVKFKVNSETARQIIYRAEAFQFLFDIQKIQNDFRNGKKLTNNVDIESHQNKINNAYANAFKNV